MENKNTKQIKAEVRRVGDSLVGMLYGVHDIADPFSDLYMGFEHYRADLIEGVYIPVKRKWKLPNGRIEIYSFRQTNLSPNSQEYGISYPLFMDYDRARRQLEDLLEYVKLSKDWEKIVKKYDKGKLSYEEFKEQEALFERTPERQKALALRIKNLEEDAK